MTKGKRPQKKHTELRAQPSFNEAIKLLERLTEIFTKVETLRTVLETSCFYDLDISEGIDFYAELQRFEVQLISSALRATAGNQRQAARLLQLLPTTLNNKMKSYNMQKSRQQATR